MKAIAVQKPKPPPMSSCPIWLTIRQSVYAYKQRYEIAAIVHLLSFISRLIAPIAAKHGAQSRLNIMKLYAVSGEKLCESVVQFALPFAAESFIPYRIPRDATIFSFAKSPARLETAACQCPKPKGTKIGAITLPR